MSDWIRIPPGNLWGELLGHSRVVRTELAAYVSGTGPTDSEGRVIGGASAYEQTKATLANISESLEAANLSIDKVVRVRIYIASFGDVQEVARAFREVFHEVRPACTLIGVSELYDPEVLVYIDADVSIT
jgi:enamine deaminase RidA (YjgF/YER057c/UK114 family)